MLQSLYETNMRSQIVSVLKIEMTTTRIKCFLYVWSKHRIMESKTHPHPSRNFSWTGHRKNTEDSPCNKAYILSLLVLYLL